MCDFHVPGMQLVTTPYTYVNVVQGCCIYNPGQVSQHIEHVGGGA